MHGRYLRERSSHRCRCGTTRGAVHPAPPDNGLEFSLRSGEISAEWVESILRRTGPFGQNRLVSVEARPTKAGFGAICNTIRLLLTYSDEAAAPESVGPASLFAKFSTDTQMSVDSCEAEVRFYCEISPHLRVRVPRCYFAGSFEDHHLVLLEDISDGYGGDSLLGCPTNMATLVMGKIAGLHARWWNREMLSEWEWLLPAPGVVSFIEKNFRDAWPRLRDRHRDILSEYVISVCDEAVTRVPEIFSVITGSPRTLLHRDLQLDNVRFDVDGDPLVLLDWGNVRIGSCVGDMAWFLTRSIPVEQRRSGGERLIREYHEALLEFGVVGFTLDDLYRQSKYFLVFLFLVIALSSVEADYASDRGGALLSAFIERGAAAIDDFRAGDVLV